MGRSGDSIPSDGDEIETSWMARMLARSHGNATPGLPEGPSTPRIPLDLGLFAREEMGSGTGPGRFRAPETAQIGALACFRVAPRAH